MNEPIATVKFIKHALIDAGVTGAEIGRRLGVSRQAVADVIACRKATPRIRAAIAEACGVSVDALWGAVMVDVYTNADRNSSGEVA